MTRKRKQYRVRDIQTETLIEAETEHDIDTDAEAQAEIEIDAKTNIETKAKTEVHTRTTSARETATQTHSSQVRGGRPRMSFYRVRGLRKAGGL